MPISLTGRQERKEKINLKTLKQKGFGFENSCKADGSKSHQARVDEERDQVSVFRAMWYSLNGFVFLTERE